MQQPMRTQKGYLRPMGRVVGVGVHGPGDPRKSATSLQPPAATTGGPAEVLVRFWVLWGSGTAKAPSQVHYLLQRKNTVLGVRTRHSV